MTDKTAPDPRPADVEGPDPVDTDNGVRPEDGEQDVSQSPDDDYSEVSDDADAG